MHHIGSHIATKEDLIRIVIEGELDEISTLPLMKPLLSELTQIRDNLDNQYTIIENYYKNNHHLDRKTYAIGVQALNIRLSWVLFELYYKKISPNNIRQIWKDHPDQKNKLINKLVSSLS